MRTLYGPQHKRLHPQVVPRELAVRIAQERDVIAAQLQKANARLARMEIQIGDLHETLGAQHARPVEHNDQQARIDLLEENLAETQTQYDALQRVLHEAREQETSYQSQLAQMQAVLDQQTTQLDKLSQSETQHEDAMRWRQKAESLESDLSRLKQRQDKDGQLAKEETRRKLLASFLELRDSLSVALIYMEDDQQNPWREGIEQVLQRFDDILTREGMVSVGQKGEAFDPTLHEAIATIQGPKPGHIAHVERPGYQFDTGTLARPAQVVVYRD